MAIEVFNRYEHKYLLNKEQFERISELLSAHMETDKYNSGGSFYTVSNIYFDTPDFTLIRKSLSKPEFKEKLRMRSYGICKMEEPVFLEVKKKYRGLVNKRRTKMTQNEALSFVKDDFIAFHDGMNIQIIKELGYFIKVNKPEPKVYIAYDRLAFFEKDDASLRISFDKNVRARDFNLTLETDEGCEKILQDNMYLMEIKCDHFMPLWLARILDDLKIRKATFSKYGTYYKSVILPRRRKENE